MISAPRVKASEELVAIIIPAFDRESLVGQTLDSVIGQTYPHWEALIVDDGSTDHTVEIAAAYARADSRIRVVSRTREPKGACTCRNQGVALTAAPYLMFLDSDDVLEPFCLEQRVRCMEVDLTLDFAIFPSLMFEKTPHDLGLWWNINKAEDELTRQFKQDAICQTTGVLWRKDSFQRIGMWDEGLAIWQDIDLFFRAFIQGYRYAKFFELPPDLHNRVTPNSLSRGGFYAPAKIASRAQVVRRAVDLLKANDMADRVPEARAMVAEIACGAARANQFEAAYGLLRWAAAEGVLLARERRALAATVFARRTRLSKVPAVRSWIGRTEAAFQAATTLGKLPHRPRPQDPGPSPSRDAVHQLSLSQSE